MLDPSKYVRLSEWCTLKQLEKPYVYDIREDELYEVDRSGFSFLLQCDGTKKLSDLNWEEDFLTFCLKEKLIQLTRGPEKRSIPEGSAPQPSLRYLEIQLTSRCNLACRHCYLGAEGKEDLDVELVKDILAEFELIQGLRIMLSGGEPLSYPFFREINRFLPDYQFRKVLLTNGIGLQPEMIDRMAVDEIQVSLDGMRDGHEMIRGEGTFAQALNTARLVVRSDKHLSIATMLHRGNLDEMEELSRLVQRMGAREWGIDVPVSAGRMSKHPELQVNPEEAAGAIRYGFGGSYHGGTQGYACGYHLCTIMPSGEVAKCGFYKDQPLGHVKEGLQTCWERNKHLSLDRLECRKCSYLQDCGAGCRYRASHPLGPDPVMCALYGVNKRG